MDGVAGLELANTGKPDLVVLDLMFPGWMARKSAGQSGMTRSAHPAGSLGTPCFGQ